MKPDISFNGISMNSLGWLRESISFPAPKSQSDTVIVPGRNSPIRFTEALGRVSYQPRSFTVTLTMLGNRARFNDMVTEAVNRFSGRLVKVICSEEPDLYAVGTVEAEPAYDPLTGKGQLVFSCEDGDAYRYHVETTTVTHTGTGRVTLFNDYMPVVPEITTTDETAFSWAVNGERFKKSVNAGTWVFPELELQTGDNSLTVIGNGTVTFTYREGRL